MPADYGTFDYDGFLLNVRATHDDGWLVSVSRRGHTPKAFVGSGEKGMDIAIEDAKRWIDQQATKSRRAR